jgi:type IV pilus assembly protein PilW
VNTRGFTLVELLVASALGALLVAGAIGAYAHARTLYDRSERLARLHENAAYALAVLEPDIQLAGYFGFHTAAAGLQVRGAVPAALAACGEGLAHNLATPLAGSDQHYGLACAAGGGGPVAGADTLTVRRASVAASAAQPGRLQLFTRRLAAADQLVIGDGLAPAPLQPGAAELRDLLVRSYYVARTADGAAAGALPALRVKSLSAVAGAPAFIDTEVLGGVEDLQVQFGYRTGAAVAEPVYVDAARLPAAAQIVAARIWLRLRAAEYDAGYLDSRHYVYANQRFAAADHFQRLLVSRTFQLRNAGS